MSSILKPFQFISRQDQEFDEYFGIQKPVETSLNARDFKTQVQQLVLAMQKADLFQPPSEQTLNLIVSHTKKIYEQIMKTNDIQILTLNLQMLERQGLSLNKVTRSDTFERDLLVSLKDRLEDFRVVTPFVEDQTIQQFREEYPDHPCVAKSEEELIWEQLSLFESENKIPADGQSLAGDIIRINIGQKVAREELKSQNLMISILTSEFDGPSGNQEMFEGILSGGLSLTHSDKKYPKVLQAIKLSQKGPLVHYGGQQALELAESTFLAIINLAGLTNELQQADNLMRNVPENELVDAFQMDVDMHNIFNQLWLRACQIKVYFVLQKNKLPDEPELEDQNKDILTKLQAGISEKCQLLQKLNVPMMMENQLSSLPTSVRYQSSFDNTQLASQIGTSFKDWKQTLLKPKETLSQKQQAIAQSVLKCLENTNQPEDLSNYLEQAKQLSQQRQKSFELLLKGANKISQDQLIEFTNFVIDYKFSTQGPKYSYVVKGGVYETQRETQETLFKFLKKINERCQSQAEFFCLLRLIRSLKFTSRDFKPLLSELNIFQLLHGIDGSEQTTKEIFEQILLRLDEEKEFSVDGLQKCVSRIDVTTSNQLLSSQVVIIIEEIKSYADVYDQIETNGPITKDSFQPIKHRYTNELLQYNLIQPLNSILNPNEQMKQDSQASTSFQKSFNLQADKKNQLENLQKGSDSKYRNLVSLLKLMSVRMENQPQLLQVLTHKVIIQTLLRALAVIGPNTGVQIAEILTAVCTHPSKMPTEVLDVCSEGLYPAMDFQVKCQSNFTQYLLSLAQHLMSQKQPNLDQQRSRYAEQIIKLASTRPQKSLLDNFTQLSENGQLLAIKYFAFAFSGSFAGDLRSDLLSQIEGFLLLKVGDCVKSYILQLLIKEKVTVLRTETVAYLCERTLFSTFQTYSPLEALSQLKKLQSNFGSLYFDIESLNLQNQNNSSNGPIESRQTQQRPGTSQQNSSGFAVNYQAIQGTNLLQPQPVNPTPSSLFGQPSNQPQPSLFSNQPGTPQQNAIGLGGNSQALQVTNLFQPQPVNSLPGSIFGQPFNQPQLSRFGSPSNPLIAENAGLFGNPTQQQQIGTVPNRMLQSHNTTLSTAQMIQPSTSGGTVFSANSPFDSAQNQTSPLQQFPSRTTEQQLATLSSNDKSPFKISPNQSLDFKSLFSAENPFFVSKKSSEDPQIKPRQLIRSLHKKNLDDQKHKKRNEFATQLFRIIDEFKIPIEIVLKALVPLDSTLAVKIDQLSKHSPHRNTLMTYLLESLLSQLPFLLQLAKAKSLITQALLEYEPVFNQETFLGRSKFLPQVQKGADEQWIKKSGKVQLEQDWIDMLAQSLLFIHQPKQPNLTLLYIMAKHYLTSFFNGWLEVQWLTPKTPYYNYKKQLMNCDQNLIGNHICQQVNLPIRNYQQNLEQLILFSELKSTKINEPLLVMLYKDITQLFLQRAKTHVDEKTRYSIYVFCNYAQSLPRHVLKAGLQRQELLEEMKSNTQDYEYFKLHSKKAFADLEDPNDGFGSWIKFVQDIQARKFDEIFHKQLGQEIDEKDVQILNRNFSMTLLHKVQKAMRHGSNLEGEFPDDGERKEERICADYVKQLVEHYNSKLFDSLNTTEREMLAEDSCFSSLKQLALFSTSLVLYDRQKFDYAKSPHNFSNRCPELSFDRHFASQYREQGKLYDGKSEQTLFTQLLANIVKLPGKYQNLFRDTADDRAFQVKFQSEGATDAGGPYRELFDSICAELISPVLPLLVPTPNQVDEFGDLRNCWMLNATCDNKDLFIFFGMLLGYAIRSTSPLLLDLHPIVWKQINNSELTLEDLRTSDLRRYQLLDKIMNAEKEGFEMAIDQNFTVVLTDDTVKELIDNGSQVQVTFKNRMNYVNLAKKAFLQVADTQAAWMRQGVEMICGKFNLAQLCWQILEERACGPPNIDINYLKANTLNRGIDRQMETMFWQVLESFSQNERVKYLQFVSGRGKLPINMSELNEKHKLTPLHGKGDESLPISHTCFFTIDLPRYSSFGVFRKNLLTAITFCSTIDGDRDIFRDGDDSD